jgi:hypothetical protein
VADLVPSHDHVDFGTIRVGQIAYAYIRLANQNVVPASWSLRTAGDKEAAVIKFRPDRGTVSGNDSVKVEVSFQPSKAHEILYKVPLKVASNSISKNIVIKGVAEDVSVDVTPSPMLFPPSLPFSNGIQCKLSFVNNGSFPVEVFCSEYDRQHLYEEAVLREVGSYEQSGLAVFPNRQPGELLARELVEAFEKLHAEERRGIDIASLDHWIETTQRQKPRRLPFPSKDPNAVEPEPVVVVETKAKSGKDAVVSKGGKEKEKERVEVVPPDEEQEVALVKKAEVELPRFVPVIVVTGLPLSGKTTASRNLAQKLFVPYVFFLFIFIVSYGYIVRYHV